MNVKDSNFPELSYEEGEGEGKGDGEGKACSLEKNGSDSLSSEDDACDPFSSCLFPFSST